MNRIEEIDIEQFDQLLADLQIEIDSAMNELEAAHAKLDGLLRLENTLQRELGILLYLQVNPFHKGLK